MGSAFEHIGGRALPRTPQRERTSQASRNLACAGVSTTSLQVALSVVPRRSPRACIANSGKLLVETIRIPRDRGLIRGHRSTSRQPSGQLPCHGIGLGIALDQNLWHSATLLIVVVEVTITLRPAGCRSPSRPWRRRCCRTPQPHPEPQSMRIRTPPSSCCPFMRTVAFTPLSASRTASADAPSGTLTPATGSTDAESLASVFTTVIVHSALIGTGQPLPLTVTPPSLQSPCRRNPCVPLHLDIGPRCHPSKSP